MWIMLYLVRVGECVGKIVVRKIQILAITVDISEDF